MQSRSLATGESGRTFILVLEEGDEAFSSVSAFANENGIAAASLTAIGAFSEATIAFFEIEGKCYRKIPVAEQCEVLSLIGDIAEDEEGNASPHLHAVLGLSDGSTRGGHFVNGLVRPTLEVVVKETPNVLRRRRRADLGIALIDLT